MLVFLLLLNHIHIYRAKYRFLKTLTWSEGEICMDDEKKIEDLSIRGKIFLLSGLLSTFFLLIMTMFFKNTISPLTMLYYRLFLITIGICYCLIVYLYFSKKLKKLGVEVENREVRIYFNGKEIER